MKTLQRGQMHVVSALLLATLALEAEPRLHAQGLPTSSPTGTKMALRVNGAIQPSGSETALAGTGDTLHLLMGHSLVLTSEKPLRRLYVGNPAVLQTFTSGTTEVVLTAKALGLSSIILWDTNGARQLYSVAVELDPGTLRASLHDAFPADTIAADMREGRIYLSGTVPTDAGFDAAGKIALAYGKDVVNTIKVTPIHAKQVELKLRIVEVDRSKLEQFGINIFGAGKNAINTSTQQYQNGVTGVGTSAFAATDPLNLLVYNFSNAIGASVKDLEQKQILQVLAEPTLTTISGVPARFLSGGEFPFPVVQGGIGNATAVTITFRPYGVKVDFTPTVNADGSIRLKVNPEVSALDYSNSVTISGFTIPALSTRRAETEVEIKDGESFVVSGLLDHRTTDSLSKIPGIANLPILGQLFRSKNLNHSTTELVVIVTARVVNPLGTMDRALEPKLVVPVLDSPGFDAETRAALHVKAAQTDDATKSIPATTAPGAARP